MSYHKPESLAEITGALRKLPRNTELAHHTADNLLADALRLLQSTPHTESDVEELLGAYREVPK